MGKTSIEWASHTWNPYTWNCTKVSQACKNCYAMTMAGRFGGKNSNGDDFLKHPPVLVEKRFEQLPPPGSVIFVNSMSDTFHEGVDFTVIDRVFEFMASKPDRIFLVLTKRIERALQYHNEAIWWPQNVWIGTSVESYETMPRLSYLTRFYGAPGRFVSAEPLLSELTDIEYYLRQQRGTPCPVNWMIAGGESGADRREHLWDLDNVRHLRDACIEHGVPFMYKQGINFKSGQNRVLDGRTWDQTPFGEEPESHTEPVQQEMF